jgi:hypothetical protein
LSAIAPNAVPLEGGLILATGVQFITGLVCNFGSYQTPASYIDSTSVTCLAPARNTSGSTTVNFWLTSQGKNYSDELPLQYIGLLYVVLMVLISLDCNTQVNSTLDQQCGTCLTRENGACSWCSETLSCTLGSFCSASADVISSSLCPRKFSLGNYVDFFVEIFSLNPSTASPAGGTVITVNGVSFLNVSGLTCTFANTISVPTTYISSTTAQCATPPYRSKGNVNFYLSLNGRQFTYPSMTFTYKKDSKYYIFI